LDTPIGNETSDAAQIYTLTTPKGGTYQITLSDGTKVWLNSASTLKYPARFNGKEREVELEGEAYFDVTHKGSASHRGLSFSTSVPFKVRSAGQLVEVLGTQFNITAYSDESAVKTTLVDGSVQIENLKSKRVNRLTPGDQSVIRGSATEIA